MARTRIPIDQAWEKEQRRIAILSSSIAELQFDLRTVNGLEAVGVLYVSQLVRLTREELQEIPNFGDKSVERILRLLDEHGLHLVS